MTVVATLPKSAHDWLKHELDPALFRKAGTIASGAGIVTTGSVLGKIATGSAVAAADAGNTGDATIAMDATPLATGVKPGIYNVTVIEPATNAGTFEVEDPDGLSIGTGDVGTLFDDVIRFTITDGATDLVAGDRFTVTVATGSEKFVPIDFAATDGSERAAAILINYADATSADVETAVLIGQAQIVPNQLVWPAGATTQQQAAALAQLAELNIISHQRG